jgi:hypothetical protein
VAHGIFLERIQGLLFSKPLQLPKHAKCLWTIFIGRNGPCDPGSNQAGRGPAGDVVDPAGLEVFSDQYYLEKKFFFIIEQQIS